MGMAQQDTSATAIHNVMIRHKCLDLRLKGYNLREIAEQAGLKSKSTVAHHINEALADLHDETLEITEKRRIIEVNRIESWLKAMETKVLAGEESAINTAIRLSERLAKLYGLDAPTKVAETKPDGTPLAEPPSMYELARRLAFMLTRGANEAPTHEGGSDVSPISTDKPSG